MNRRRADARNAIIVSGTPLASLAGASIAFGLGFLFAPLYIAIALLSIGACLGGALL